MKIAICDDVELYNRQLKEMLSGYGCSITEYSCGQALLEGHSRGLFDYIFLDVEMPGIDGFEAAGKIRETDTAVGIVFVTHMESRMQKGYIYGAKDYLCKPVTQQLIDDLMDRLLDEERRKNESVYYNVKLKFDEGTIRLKLADVLYFESNDRYILATTAEEAHTFRGRLSDVEKELKDRGFVRVHRSYLVNIRYAFKHFGGYILLRTGEKIEVGKKYRTAVDKAFMGLWQSWT